ncbi:AAA family ATPase [Microlunatus lacustris]
MVGPCRGRHAWTTAILSAMISTLAVAGYRSLRDLRLPLGQLSVVTGANGSGKSSLYRALRLLADCARGGVVSSLAQEGGLPSVLWAGPESTGASVRAGDIPVRGTSRRGPVSLMIGFSSDGFSYLADLGMPGGLSRQSAFTLDPEVKRELVWAGPVLRPATTLLRRQGPLVQVRHDDGSFAALMSDLDPFESALAAAGDPAQTPEVLAVRGQVRSWRFYDSFRTDAGAPARASHIGTRTTALADDGSDLAAALQTIREIGAPAELEACVEDAFPGSSLQISSEAGRFDLALTQPGLLRPLRTAELSDGTLRYLLWLAALLSPRPGELVVLNEPETSLHPDLLPALARLIARAATRSQVLVVTHDDRLATFLAAQPAAVTIELEKDLGETRVVGAGALDQPVWSWGSR